jgi:hypothetical protein
MKVLCLTLKAPWFALVAAGEKREEYRKPGRWIESRVNSGRSYDLVEFINGYGPKRPFVYVEFLGFHYGEGNPAWGAVPGQRYLVIRLGRVWGNLDSFISA